MRIKFVFLTITSLVGSLVIYVGISNHLNEALRLKVDGKVMAIEWQSKNHNLPLFLIKPDSKPAHYVQAYGLSLTSDDIQVGDWLHKSRGSKNCMVNEVKIQCVR